MAAISSPASRWTARTSSAFSSTGRPRWPRDLGLVTPRSHIDHRHKVPVRGQPTLLGIPSLPLAKICDMSPLAGLQLS